MPVLLAVMLVQNGTLFGLTAGQAAMDRGVATLSAYDDILSSLKDAQANADRYIATGNDQYLSEYQEGIAHLESVRHELEDLTHGDAAAQSDLLAVENLLAKWLSLRQQSVDSRGIKGSAHESDVGADSGNLMVDIGNALAQTRAHEQVKLASEKDVAARSARTVGALIQCGGAFTIWLIGVAAFLLFYDEDWRFRAAVEQQLHADTLESLPLGVCLVSESGVIVYANPAAEAAFGYHAGELIARNITSLHGSDETELSRRYAEISAPLLSKEVWFGHLPIRKKNGEIVHIASWVTNMKFGQKYCRLLVHDASVPWHLEREEPLHAGIGSTPEAVGETPIPIRPAVSDPRVHSKLPG